MPRFDSTFDEKCVPLGQGVVSHIFFAGYRRSLLECGSLLPL